MKLREGAIIMIIGAVVVGPINVARSWVSTGACACDLADRPGPDCPIKEELDGSQCHVRYETTAEACDRVMLEIGARAHTPIDFFGQETPDEKKALEQWKPGDPYILRWYVAGRRVLCLAAPSGLVR